MTNNSCEMWKKILTESHFWPMGVLEHSRNSRIELWNVHSLIMTVRASSEQSKNDNASTSFYSSIWRAAPDLKLQMMAHNSSLLFSPVCSADERKREKELKKKRKAKFSARFAGATELCGRIPIGARREAGRRVRLEQTPELSRKPIGAVVISEVPSTSGIKTNNNVGSIFSSSVAVSTATRLRH